MLHSYYEYEFLDISIIRSLQIFEMALRIKYGEIMDQSGDKLDKSQKYKSFRKLINWAKKEEIFAPNAVVMKSLLSIRNSVIHGNANDVMGIATLEADYIAVDFVNDLYESPDL